MKYLLLAIKFTLNRGHYSTLSTLVVTVSVLFFQACSDPKAAIPSYLHISTFEFTTDLSTEGSASHDIPDVHVYINGKLMGIYELPLTLPVLEEGPCNIVLFPGIKENGSRSTRRIMRLYETYETIRVLKPGEIDSIFPTTQYRNNVEFAWIEDYENGVFTTLASNKNTTLDSITVIDSSHVNAFKDGISRYSGKFKIPAQNDMVYFEHASAESFILPRQGRDVYLEVDYKTNVPLQIGIWAQQIQFDEQIPFIVLNPTERWNKIYINLTIETSALDPNTPVRIFYGVFKQQGDTKTSPEVYLDNIKLAYLN